MNRELLVSQPLISLSPATHLQTPGFDRIKNQPRIPRKVLRLLNKDIQRRPRHLDALRHELKRLESRDRPARIPIRHDRPLLANDFKVLLPGVFADAVVDRLHALSTCDPEDLGDVVGGGRGGEKDVVGAGCFGFRGFGFGRDGADDVAAVVLDKLKISGISSRLA